MPNTRAARPRPLGLETLSRSVCEDQRDLVLARASTRQPLPPRKPALPRCPENRTSILKPLNVLYELGDFLDDYRVDRELRNDLGLLFLVDLAGSRLEAIPLKLEYAHTRFADGEDAAWIRRRFADACAAFGTAVTEEDGRLVCSWR